MRRPLARGASRLDESHPHSGLNLTAALLPSRLARGGGSSPGGGVLARQVPMRDAAAMPSAEPLLQLELQNDAGRPVRLAEWLAGPLVVVFVRHFG